MFTRLLRFLLLPALLALAGAAFAFPDEGEDDFLPVREAFRLVLNRDDSAFIAHWDIAPGYYMYRDKLSVRIEDADGNTLALLGAPDMPAGEMKEDEIFGRVAVFHDALDMRLPLVAPPPDGVATLAITYQGCAEAGLCYAPETERWPADFTGMTPVAAAAAGEPLASAPATTAAALTDSGAVRGFLASASLPAILGMFVLLGLGLAFTPCVLPMVPILSSIIVGQGTQVSARRGFMLSLAYVLGMALTYTAAGVAVGFLGAKFNIQGWLQSPPVLIGFALLFVALSLSMFGFYELQLPSALRDRLNDASGRRQGGKLAGVAVMGAISALVLSPCVSAPLAGVLMFISTTGDALLGGAALFALALGMGLPLLLLGASGGQLLPRAGAWMNAVKGFFGVLLLGVAVLLLGRLLPGWVTLALWGSLLVVYAIYLKALEPLAAAANGWAHLRKGVGLVLLLYGTTLLIGAAGGADDPFKPLGFLAERGSAGGAPAGAEELFERVADTGALEARLAEARAAGRPVMLDFYADWCVACRIMERDVFSQTAVHAALSGYEVLQVDATRNSPAVEALLQGHQVLGLPSILFFTPDGRELRDARIEGELDQAGFLAWLDSRIEPNLR